jgi:parallel beta-helix repeat protein
MKRALMVVLIALLMVGSFVSQIRIWEEVESAKTESVAVASQDELGSVGGSGAEFEQGSLQLGLETAGDRGYAIRPLAVPPTEWTRQYGGVESDVAWSVLQTSDGGYLVVGETYSYGSGSYDFWVVKTDSSGTQQWTKTYGGSAADRARFATRTYDGGYVVVGYTDPSGSDPADVLVVKIDSAGNKQWDLQWGGSNRDQAYSVIQSSDGRYIVVGYTMSFGAGNEDAFLLMIDPVLGTSYRTYGGSNTDVIRSVMQTSDGGFALAGYTNSIGSGSYDFWLIKTSYDGTMLWQKTYGNTGSDMAYSIAQTSEGGYVLAGDTDYYTAGSYDFYVVKTDSSGNLAWSQKFGGTGLDSASSVVQTCDGGYLIAGETTSFGAALEDFWVVKTDSSLSKQWDQRYGGSGSDRAYSALQASDGGYTITGPTSSYGAGSNDFWLVKLGYEYQMADLRILPRMQHKDTKMLCLDGCSLSGVHAWDVPHLSENWQGCLHDNMYCTRASISMINSYYGGRLSQDRISYYYFEQLNRDGKPGPEGDLGHNVGMPADEALSWALNGAVGNHYSEKPDFSLIKAWIDASKPILRYTVSGVGHFTVIDGYAIVGSDNRVHLLDPWCGSQCFVSYSGLIVDQLWWTPASATPRSDEDWNSNGMLDTMEDSDSDGVCDFDEIYRFLTTKDQSDTDSDGVADKPEIVSYTFLNDGSWDALDVRNPNPDGDFDGQGRPLRAERDYDSDNGGVPDGLEDKNGNGFFEPALGETDPLDASDDPNPIHLESKQDNAASTNLGTIEFAGSNYPLPNDITKPAKTYNIKYYAASGYVFDHWEVTPGISVADPNAQSATVIVTGGGTLRAVYKQGFVVHLESSQDTGGSVNLGSTIFDGITYSLPNDVTKSSGTYSIGYNNASGYVFYQWETTLGVSVANPNLCSTTATVSGSGTLRARYKHIPVITCSLKVKAESPVNLLVTDLNGFRVGYDYLNDSVVNEIPGATYSGPGSEPQEITVPNPLNGSYQIEAFGTGTGSYTITTESLAPNGSIVDIQTWQGVAVPSKVYTETVNFSQDGRLEMSPWFLQWSRVYGGYGHSQFAQPIGDLDGDGVNEVVVGGYETLGSGRCHILEYNKTLGSYLDVYNWTEGGGDYNAPSGATMLDLDGDGILELVVSWSYSGANDGVWAYKWNGTALTKLDHYYSSFVFDVYSCDIDGDGVKEVVVANAPWGGTPYHVIGLGWNTTTNGFYFKAGWELAGYDYMECPMVWNGDIDFDGQVEIVAVISNSSFNTAGVWALHWNSTMGQWMSQQVYAGPFNGTPYGVVVGAVSSRRRVPEIGVGTNGATDAYLFQWNGTGYEMVWHGNWPGEASVIEGVAIGDADNDGLSEFCVGTDDVHVIRWTGSGYMEESTITATSGLLSGVNIGDCDTDGLNELKACDILDYSHGKEWIFKFVKYPDLTVFEPEVTGPEVNVNGVVFPGNPGTYITKIHWDWSDGKPEDHWFPVTHTYGLNGNYTITVTAYQSDGLHDTEIKNIIVQTVTPAHNLNTNLNYTTIQAAIDAAETLDGQVIFVDEGTYYEHLIINKSLSLIGENATTTVIDGNFTGTVIQVSASNVRIEGFRIINGGGIFPDAGIKVYYSNASIIQNSIANCGSCGIYIYEAERITIQRNNITDVASAGIYLSGVMARNNAITENRIVNSSQGLVLSGSFYNVVTRNTIANNSNAGIVVVGGGNVIYHNDFLLNAKHAKMIGRAYANTWDDGYPSGGNYWTGYGCADLYSGFYQNGTCSDGISDTPYTIYLNNEDRFPSTQVWNLQAHLLAFDDFESGNLDGWTIVNGNWTLVNGTLVQSDTDSWPTIIWSGNKTWTDYVFQARVKPTGGTGHVFILFRFADNETFYLFGIRENWDSVVWNKCINGTWGQEISKSMTIQQDQWYTLTIIVRGTCIEGYVDDLLCITTSDASIPAGAISLDTHAASACFDNVVIRALYAVHNLAVADVLLPKNITGEGYNCTISVIVANTGSLMETFNVTLYANTTSIETQEITLTSTSSATLTFEWNTTDFAKGNYTINAYAWPVQGETNKADNNFTGGAIYVGVPGDVDGNHKVDIKDILIVAKAYGTNPQSPNWNPNADVNCDDKVDIKDILITAKNYGKTDP